MATRKPLMAMTAVQALCRMAKMMPDQLMNEMLIMNIRDGRTGALTGGISAAFSAGSDMVVVDGFPQDLGVHFK